MYFLKAVDFHLPMFCIWISEAPRSAAAVAAPMRKLWDWYRFVSNPQKAREFCRFSVKNWRETGFPSMKENKASFGEVCFLICIKYCTALTGQSKWFSKFRLIWRDVGLMECLQWGIVSSIEFSWFGHAVKFMCFTNKKCWFSFPVLVISPTLRNALNASTYIAWSKALIKAELVTWGRDNMIFNKIVGVIGNLASCEGFALE